MYKHVVNDISSLQVKLSGMSQTEDCAYGRPTWGSLWGVRSSPHPRGVGASLKVHTVRTSLQISTIEKLSCLTFWTFWLQQNHDWKIVLCWMYFILVRKLSLSIKFWFSFWIVDNFQKTVRKLAQSEGINVHPHLLLKAKRQIKVVN